MFSALGCRVHSSARALVSLQLFMAEGSEGRALGLDDDGDDE